MPAAWTLESEHAASISLHSPSIYTVGRPEDYENSSDSRGMYDYVSRKQVLLILHTDGTLTCESQGSNPTYVRCRGTAWKQLRKGDTHSNSNMATASA